jgi:hypothetical protein
MAPAVEPRTGNADLDTAPDPATPPVDGFGVTPGRGDRYPTTPRSRRQTRTSNRSHPRDLWPTRPTPGATTRSTEHATSPASPVATTSGRTAPGAGGDDRRPRPTEFATLPAGGGARLDPAMTRREWVLAWREEPDDPQAVMAEHARGPGTTCARCTELGVGSNNQPVEWPCNPYLAARRRAALVGLPLPEDGLPPEPPG